LYDAAGCAFRVEEVAGGYRLMTRPMFGPWLRRAFQTPVETRLSAPAMETLAVVAYRQPILRAEIESIRGVQCGDILRQLMDRDLIRIIGRSEDLGRPLVYGTTKRFLEVFGLRHLDELPRAEHFRATQSAVSSEPQTDSPPNNDPGAGRVNDHSTTVHSPEEESVTTRIRPAKFKEDFLEEAALSNPSAPAPTMMTTTSKTKTMKTGTMTKRRMRTTTTSWMTNGKKSMTMMKRKTKKRTMKSGRMTRTTTIGMMMTTRTMTGTMMTSS
jgi:segregation and condensation protein B